MLSLEPGVAGTKTRQSTRYTVTPLFTWRASREHIICIDNCRYITPFKSSCWVLFKDLKTSQVCLWSVFTMFSFFLRNLLSALVVQLGYAKNHSQKISFLASIFFIPGDFGSYIQLTFISYHSWGTYMFREARAPVNETSINFLVSFTTVPMRWPKYILTWLNWFKGHTNEYKWWGWIAKNNWTSENPSICKIQVAVTIMQVSVKRIKIKGHELIQKKQQNSPTRLKLQERPFVSESRVEFQTALEQVEKALEAAAAIWCCWVSTI